MRGRPDLPREADPRREAAVFDFVNDYMDDVERGGPRSLGEYLARFPEHQDAIAREYLNLSGSAFEDTRVGADPTRDQESAGPRRVGPYRLLRQLGEGGQGAVFLAEDTRIARRVALKLLRAGFVSEIDRRRFRREAEAIVGLEHPGLCGVLEAEVEGEVPYLAMRYVEGVTLGQVIADARGEAADGARPAAAGEAVASDAGGPQRAAVDEDEADPAPAAGLPVRPRSRGELVRVLRFFERAARALHAAHTAGVIHRDIKPGNMILTPEGDPVVLDFGLARTKEPDGADELTMSGQVFGTPLYMSPEQLRGKRDELDERTDVYSLGVTLFEALTLERPFQANNRVALEMAILTKPAPDPRGFNDALDEDVRVVLQTALEKESASRYSSALELAEDLRRVREFEPIHARPAGPVLRLRRWARRQPVIAALLLVTLASLVTGLAVSLSLLASERQALTEKDEALGRARGQLMAQRALELSGDNAEAALAVAVEAVELIPHYTTKSALLVAMDACRLERRLDRDEVQDVARFFDIAFDAETRRVAAAPLAYGTGEDAALATVPVWDLTDGSIVCELKSSQTGLRSIAWSPVADVVLAGGRARSARALGPRRTSGRTARPARRRRGRVRGEPAARLGRVLARRSARRRAVDRRAHVPPRRRASGGPAHVARGGAEPRLRALLARRAPAARQQRTPQRAAGLRLASAEAVRLGIRRGARSARGAPRCRPVERDLE